MARQGDQPAPPSGKPGPSSVNPCPPMTRRVKEALIHVWGKINCYFIILINWYTAICFHYSTHIAGKIIPSFSTSLHCCFTATLLLEAFGGLLCGLWNRSAFGLDFLTRLLESAVLTEPAPKVSTGISSMSRSLLTKHTAQHPTSLSFGVQFV